jgi:hypothetical protein
MRLFVGSLQFRNPPILLAQSSRKLWVQKKWMVLNVEILNYEWEWHWDGVIMSLFGKLWVCDNV